MTGLELFPEPASTLAYQTDQLYFAYLVISGAIVLLVITLVVTFSLRYRKRSQTEPRPPATSAEREFEIGWTVATFFVFVVLFAWTGSAQLSALIAPKTALEIHVVGKQWMWKVQHSNGAREINTLHVPVDEPVKLILTSEDVIHSFFVPAFRVKKDVLPGRYLETWFIATKTGKQHLFCTQYCGTQHSRMIGEVVVVSRDDYVRWLRGQPASFDLAKEGAALFVSLGCAACHSPGSSVKAPQLAGLYGSTVKLSDGRTVKADDAYLREHILEPDKARVAGFEPIMPSFRGVVSDTDLNGLIAYIHSLSSEETRK
jgi:cytochrome c oxidase subunit 2